MGRYSPTTQQISALEALAEVGHSVADRRDEVRDRRADEEARAAEDAERREGVDLDRGMRGLRRGTAPTRMEEMRAPEMFEQELPGASRYDEGADVPDIFEDERPSFLPGPRAPLPQATGEAPPPALDGALAELQRPRKPKVRHLAGSYVRGMGFTERTLTDQDVFGGAAPGEQLRQPQTRETADPRYRQVTDDYYLDEEATPEARTVRAKVAGEEADFGRESGRLEGVLSRLGRGGRAEAEAMAAGVPGSVVFDEPDEPDPVRGTVVRSGNRNVLIDPTTGDTLKQYDPLPEPGGRGRGAGDDPGSRLVALRQRAMGAARAVLAIQQGFARSTVGFQDPGAVNARITAALRPFGFRSVDELEESMRSLGLEDDTPGAGEPEAEPVTIEEIDAFLDDHPEITDEQIDGMSEEEIRGLVRGQP